MKLDHYDVTIIISDPDDAKTQAKATMESCPRAKLLEMPFFGSLVQTFEEMVDENDQRFSCQNKIRYSEESAKRAADEMQRKRRRPFDAYKCRHCPGWHVGGSRTHTV